MRGVFQQMDVPAVDAIEGCRQRSRYAGAVGQLAIGQGVTTLSDLLRMLYSRAGEYRVGRRCPCEAFSPDTPEGGRVPSITERRVYSVTEDSMVPDQH
jgi:excinuclease ABC subunit A